MFESLLALTIQKTYAVSLIITVYRCFFIYKKKTKQKFTKQSFKMRVDRCDQVWPKNPLVMVFTENRHTHMSDQMIITRSKSRSLRCRGYLTNARAPLPLVTLLRSMEHYAQFFAKRYMRVLPTTSIFAFALNISSRLKKLFAVNCVYMHKNHARECSQQHIRYANAAWWWWWW